MADRDQAREQLRESEQIRHAEKEILIKEIETVARLREQVDTTWNKAIEAVANEIVSAGGVSIDPELAGQIAEWIRTLKRGEALPTEPGERREG